MDTIQFNLNNNVLHSMNKLKANLVNYFIKGVLKKVPSKIKYVYT